jgi:hypothetical protein
LRCVAAFERRVVEVEHDLDGAFVTNGPEGHQKILGAGLNAGLPLRRHVCRG